MPGLIHHLDSWTLEEGENNETIVTWKVDFEFKRWHWFSPFLGSFFKTFQQVQQEALISLETYPKA